MKISEREAKEHYDDMLNELYPLSEIACNSFSILLEEGDPIAYNCGFADFCDAKDYELS